MNEYRDLVDAYVGGYPPQENNDADIPIEIVPMEEKHLNWVRSSWKRSFRLACSNIIDTQVYYDLIMNPMVESLLKRLYADIEGIVAVADGQPTEYLGWLMYYEEQTRGIIYTYTSPGTNKLPFREMGICTALLKCANLSFLSDTMFRTNIWQSITQTKKEQHS